MPRDDLVGLDRDHCIHSTVSWAAHERRGATILERGEGVYLIDANGNRILDGFSGLWCVNIGYGQQSVVDACAAQMARLPYATSYFHYASRPSIELAAALAARAPGDLDHVFFTQGGSDAIDSAIRLIRYYFNVTGHPSKKHMIALDRGYHGSSAAGAGLTGLSAFHDDFDLPMSVQHHIPTLYSYRYPGSPEELISESIRSLRDKVNELGSENVAAFFAEPVIGSGGVIIPPDGWLKAIRETCDALGILLVIDEVITAFGRTGPLFGCNHDGVQGDVMTLAKGLTSGYAPMGATLLSDRIYQGIKDASEDGRVIGHGLTYSGHPVSAAVALEVLRLYEEGGVLANGRASGVRLVSGLESLRDHPLVGDVRVRGMLAAIELVVDKNLKTRPPNELHLPERLAAAAYANGLAFRAFSDSMIGLAPPLIATIDEIDLMISRISRTLDQMLECADVRAALQSGHPNV